MLKKPRRSVAAVHRQAVEAARRRGWPEPACHQVRRIVRRMDSAMLKLAHEGAKAYGQSYDLPRSGGAGGPNEIWQADHTLLDVWLMEVGLGGHVNGQ